jgi:hypothetical protein
MEVVAQQHQHQHQQRWPLRDCSVGKYAGSSTATANTLQSHSNMQATANAMPAT